MERFVFKYLLIESKDGFLLTGSSAFAEDDRAGGAEDAELGAEDNRVMV